MVQIRLMVSLSVLLLCRAKKEDSKVSGHAESVPSSAVAIVDDGVKVIKASGVLLTPNRVFSSCHPFITPRNRTEPRPPSAKTLRLRATVGNIGLDRSPEKYSSSIVDIIVSEECYYWEKHALNVDVAMLKVDPPFKLETGKVGTVILATHIRYRVPQLWKALVKGKEECLEVGYPAIDSKRQELTFSTLKLKKVYYCAELDAFPLTSYEEYLQSHGLGCAQILNKGNSDETRTAIEAGGPLICKNAFFGMSHGQLSLVANKSFTVVTQLDYYLPFINKIIDPMEKMDCESMNAPSARETSKTALVVMSKSERVTGFSYVFLGIIIVCLSEQIKCV